MAELHVEPKKQNSSIWMWILVALVILGVVAYFLLRDNKAGENNNVNGNSTSYIQGYYTKGLNENTWAA